ncbi:TetR/AcrR family transcriptional regulator [Methylomonas sp. UP202]|uniref:TetR/AcrR family transcriptional regulator n=1 Tax=Methylomonas sp. UP202 TaxID=3040943 RepID=UPI002478B0B9|nr:TetR/AcrR family transcriptional regulator [Methylomonas sp. UP202]WGS84012.1 TetR/AcrR family transcriptional regulator [Methylomonas sp. UP202]
MSIQNSIGYTSVRYTADQKQQTCQRIIEAAGRCFRKGGYSGIGVDGLAKEAGVTSGAFYGHFSSKAEAFKAVIIAGMKDLKSGIGFFKQQHGENWWEEFAKFYMGPKRTCDLGDSCILQSVTPEVCRSEEAIRAAFESELLEIVKLAADGTPEAGDQAAVDKAWANFAMLIGGVTLARAVTDEKIANEIAMAVQQALITRQKRT